MDAGITLWTDYDDDMIQVISGQTSNINCSIK